VHTHFIFNFFSYLGDFMTYSHTAYICENAMLFSTAPAEIVAGYDAPTKEDAEGLTARMMDSVIELCTDTCNELDTQSLLWEMVNMFHRHGQKLERDVDSAMLKLTDLSKQQDGSEIASYELEQATAKAKSLQTRLYGLETMREAAATCFTEITGDAWQPRTGSRKAQGTLTAGMYDAKKIQQQRQRDKAQIAMPEGAKIVVTGGACQDYNRLYNYLDNLKAKYDANAQKMVILHGGLDNGVDKIVCTLANNRNIAQVAFRPKWEKGNQNKSAPFKRNDELIAELPDMVIIINPSSGIHGNLADKAKKAGIKTIIREEAKAQAA
jgi:hypothetical protein